MIIHPAIAAFHADMIAWRRDLHAHPETAFEEHRTADKVAGLLAGFGLPVHRGLAGTGVVASLKVGDSPRAIGLRADMDALDVQERNTFDHKSRHPGKMHACGHDGHTTMLLGAARYLAETRGFDGTVHFIFQPAEENEGGGRVMVEQGLFERFPVDAVFGLHNWPGLPVGEFAIMTGPMMAAYDVFEIIVSGRGCHGAMPHQGIDPILVAAHLVQAIQSIASRRANPQDAAVVSVTQIHAGDAWNIVPDQVMLRGTTRSFDPVVQDMIEAELTRLTTTLPAAFGASATLRYERRYPPTINNPAETELAATAMAALVGRDRVHRHLKPTMGGEDFAFMLQARPGCYGWIGNGPGESGCVLHNPHYDFNDDILTLGASYWATLVEQILKPLP